MGRWTYTLLVNIISGGGLFWLNLAAVYHTFTGRIASSYKGLIAYWGMGEHFIVDLRSDKL